MARGNYGIELMSTSWRTDDVKKEKTSHRRQSSQDIQNQDNALQIYSLHFC